MEASYAQNQTPKSRELCRGSHSAKLLAMLQLKADDTVSITLVSNRLIIEPLPRLRYTLAELLASSDYSEVQPPEEREWVDASAVGREIN